MRIEAMNWMQVEARLVADDRCVLPLGCTEQHAYLSLSTDSILASRVSVDAAEPLGVPVFPVLSYGLTPTFRDYPGTVTLSLESYCRIVVEIVASLTDQGFRRILIVNGHGGNIPARAAVVEWLSRQTLAKVQWHDWWMAPRTIAKVREIDPDASHASWMENFSWTRIAEADMPTTKKPMVDLAALRQASSLEARQMLGDGNFGGLYVRSDREMAEIWAIAVDETRELLEEGWLRLST